MSYQLSPVDFPDASLKAQLTPRNPDGSQRHFFSPTPIQRIELRILIALPAVSLAILTLYSLRNVIQRNLPTWLQPFAKDDGTSDEAEGSPPPKQKRWTAWTYLLGAVCMAGLVLSFLRAILVFPRQPAVMLEAVPWVVASLIWSYDRPSKAPRLLLTLLVFILVAYLASCSLHFLNHTLLGLDPYRLSQAILSLVGIILIGNMPLRPLELSSSKIGSANGPPSSSLRSPEDNLTLFQFWTMKWVYPLAKVEKARPLSVKDVWQLPFEYQHLRLYHAFKDLKGDLVWRLGRANGLDLTIATALSVTERVAEVSNIRLAARLYQALDRNDTEKAVFWCLAMFLVDGGRQLAKTTGSWYSRKAYERSRGETFIGLFVKMLSRVVPASDMLEKSPDEDVREKPPNPFVWLFSKCCGRRSKYIQLQDEQKDTDQPASNAKVINLLRGDAYEISQRFWELCKMISAPIKIGFTAYYLFDIMGWPAMVGCGAMAIFIVINFLLMNKNIQMERQRTMHTDQRAQAVGHFVEASRALKLNGWTEFWQQRILSFRKSEMLKRLHMSYMSALIAMTTVTGGMLYPLASIGLYTLVEGQKLPNEVIWPSLQLFAQLEVTVKELFDLISATWKATIPVGRVHKFMEEPDQDQTSGDSNVSNVQDIAFKNASFAWPHKHVTMLHGLNLSFPSGLTIVKGKVGTGKSGLLLAALNEMEIQGGNLIRPSEPIAYAQQLPWLQNKSIRDNIIFHARYDRQRYKDTLRACALGPDLAILPGGDANKLEEGGVGLSGGQKARVALARAVYSPARILLLDDPLAALDHDTASLIVRRLLQGPLAKDRTIVMATHRDELVLRIADQVVEVADGTARTLTPDEVQEELKHPHHESVHDSSANDDSDSHGHVSDEVASEEEEPEEAGRIGSIKFPVYLKYMRAGGLHLWLSLALFHLASRVCDISRAQLLELWGRDTAADTSSIGAVHRLWGIIDLPDPNDSPKVWVSILGAFSVGQVVSYTIAQYLLARICFHAASGLFETAIDRVGKATFRYHDTTPTGQLKNRLIADMGMVDGGILTPLESCIANMITLLASLAAITVQQPILLIFLLGMVGLFRYFFTLYLPISRALRRMEMRYLTPILSNVGVMQHGLVTIRALRVERHFQERHLDAVDDFQKHDHFYWGMSFWLDFRLSMSSAIMRAVLVLFMVWWGTPASVIGFVLTQAGVAVIMVQQLCEKFATLQLDAVSLERVDMLNEILEETNGDEQPPEDWPRKEDDIKFENMSFRYDEHLPKVLDDVSFEIPGGSTCAVLGRTGSGKSTIANALLATEIPASGTVKIGGYDLSVIDRTALRHRVTFIQQDPTLFPGTLRDNIDPQGRFSDSECLNAIQRVLGPGWTLDTRVDAGGKNLSQGQRQLVSIGRAIVRRSGLVILDEATASIDRKTAAKVQRLLREELSGSTVVTIAHRLEAVEDAGWCLRLKDGRVQECGPAKGLSKGKGKAHEESEE